ncbi:methylenetetrahydrofolate reductase C-terminal domain-containing protein [Holophaga foetida]|uniref:methylenetetrahydrofolate reductase C-terminal domain-containing protein n=1 Tax=Holophaga foetida TaxID=35839 RepID=UPI000A02FE27|nr:methylenetetrahydrofolate reductase C-terminal domain-containing protein [Holophaga foetida]
MVDHLPIQSRFLAFEGGLPVEHLGTFQQSLQAKDVFSVTWELVPGRGAREKAQDVVFASAEKAAKGGRIHALTITDNPGGHPALAAEMLGVEINKLGIEPLVHFTCKDKNRNQMEGLLHGMERASIHNLLVMTGDYTYSGHLGRAKPVFDYDPTHLLTLITDMNQGLEVPTMKGTARLAPSHFFAGAAASPFKATEAELVTQYYKLKKKLDAGAQFIVSQLGYDARKFHELLQMVKHMGYGHIPVLGNIFILPLGAAKLMNRNGLPGCVATNELVAALDAESKAADKGKGLRLERAAKMYAFMKGMGFDGVHIGGHGVSYDDFEFVVGRGEELVPNWRDLVHEFNFPQAEGFYYFEKDAKTGLNTETPVDRSERPSSPLSYKAMLGLHHAAFEPGGMLFKPMQTIAAAVDGKALEHSYTKVEHLIKVVSNECESCGDCALFDLAYLCPMSQCPKAQRNGPCGGGLNGYCEVYPKGSHGEMQCIHVRAYNRLKSHGAEEQLGAYPIPPVNYDARWTSSWLNFYLGRDHSAKRLGIEAPKKDT